MNSIWRVDGPRHEHAQIPAATARPGLLPLKRAFDVIAASAGLILLSPVIAMVVAYLSLCERGPIVFAHERIGRGGRRFRCLKFRTMCVEADRILQTHLARNPDAAREWAATQKLKSDPRVFPFGRVLRKTSLDELPQLINILKGDMSVVGPRPIVAGNHRNHAGDAAYARSDDFRYYNRFRPGITGLWQVSCRNTSDYSERVRLDRWYARNWSLWLDVVILYKTVSALVRRTGC